MALACSESPSRTELVLRRTAVPQQSAAICAESAIGRAIVDDDTSKTGCGKKVQNAQNLNDSPARFCVFLRQEKPVSEFLKIAAAVL